MANLREDADNYIVDFTEGNFVVVSVYVKKPCPLREVMQRAEAFLNSFRIQRGEE